MNQINWSTLIKAEFCEESSQTNNGHCEEINFQPIISGTASNYNNFCNISKTVVLNKFTWPVINDESSPFLYNFIHGYLLWLSNEQRWCLVLSHTELLAWISRIRRARYFTHRHVDASLGWLLGDDCHDLDYSHANYEKKEGVGPWKKIRHFFQTRSLYLFRWVKMCRGVFRGNITYTHIKIR